MTNLSDLKLQQVIPSNLTQDVKVRNLAHSVDGIMRDVNDCADKLNYKVNLEDLPTEVIDHMLYEKHITWSEGLLLIDNKQQKVELLKAAIELHRTKGTPYAVERVFGVLGLNANLIEWFEYGGDPYRFKIDVKVNDNGINENQVTNLENLLNQFKNERSHLETITFFVASDQTGKEVAAHTTGEAISIMPELVTMLVSADMCKEVAAHTTGEAISIMPELVTMLVSTDTCNHITKFIYAETLTIYP